MKTLLDMLKRWKVQRSQRRCLHWFDGPSEQIGLEYGAGAFVLTEQRRFRRLFDRRTCLRCALVDELTIKVECLGWQ